jgi:hypothetical protein
LELFRGASTPLAAGVELTKSLNGKACDAGCGQMR